MLVTADALHPAKPCSLPRREGRRLPLYADNNQHKLLFAIESVPEEEWSKAYTETVYGVTSSATSSATRSEVLLAASRGHWQIENGLHWVRDAMGEDASKVRSGSAPRVLATLRNLTIGVLRLAGVSNNAQGRRHLSCRPEFALTLLGV